MVGNTHDCNYLSVNAFVVPKYNNNNNMVGGKTNYRTNPFVGKMTKRMKKRSSSSLLDLKMSLLPIPAPTLNQLLTTTLPTPAQYSTYWGRTSREKYNAIFEAFGVSFLGVFAAYFFSFVVGQFVATLLGTVAAFWVLLGPEVKAYQRNWELRGGRELVDPWMTKINQQRRNSNDYYNNGYSDFYFDDDDLDMDDIDDDNDVRGLFGAYYFGRVVHASIVEHPTARSDEEYSLDDPLFENYTMETDEQEQITGSPYRLRLRITDSGGRTLQVHARMSEEYLDIERGMPVCAVLLSTNVKFDILAGLTDFCIPDAECWVGDYPYLDRPVLESELVNDDRLWNALKQEGKGNWGTQNENEDSTFQKKSLPP